MPIEKLAKNVFDTETRLSSVGSQPIKVIVDVVVYVDIVVVVVVFIVNVVVTDQIIFSCSQ